jgi:hypothetical protein
MGPLAEGLFPISWSGSVLSASVDSRRRQCVWMCCCRDNGQLYDTLELGYVLETYRIVGEVRLRQVRVTNTSCNERRFLSLYDNSSGDQVRLVMLVSVQCVSGTCIAAGVVQYRFDNKDGTCWSEFVESVEDTQPYGPGALHRPQ